MHKLIEQNFLFRDEQGENTKKKFLKNVAIRGGFKIDRGIGLIGIYLKEKFPSTYKSIRKSSIYKLLIKTRDTFLFSQ